MNPLTSISARALSHPEEIALSCRHRITTYRKLASRIERATARLQAEWNVRPGDTVAYAGSGHQDAIVLWLALVQSGAHLLLLEGAEDPEAAMLMQEYRVGLLLNDGGERGSALPESLRIEPLHALIAEHCPHPANVVSSGIDTASLLRCRSDISATPGALPASESSWHVPPSASVIPVRAAELFSAVQPSAGPAELPLARIFDEGALEEVVLATLCGGGALRLV